MALENLGRSFLPTGGSPEAAGRGGNRLEDILRVISFRMPRILGARPVAPAELLNAPGSSAPFGRELSEGIMQNLMKTLPGPPPEQSGPEDPGALPPPMVPRLPPTAPTPRIRVMQAPAEDEGFDISGEEGFENIFSTIRKRLESRKPYYGGPRDPGPIIY